MINFIFKIKINKINTLTPPHPTPPYRTSTTIDYSLPNHNHQPTVATSFKKHCNLHHPHHHSISSSIVTITKPPCTTITTIVHHHPNFFIAVKHHHHPPCPLVSPLVVLHFLYLIRPANQKNLENFPYVNPTSNEKEKPLVLFLGCLFLFRWFFIHNLQVSPQNLAYSVCVLIQQQKNNPLLELIPISS